MLRTEKIKVIILAAGRDFGRCPVASRLPTALWPVMGKPSLERIIVDLAEHGVRDITVCCNGDIVMLQKSIKVPQNAGLNVRFLDEPLPMGTAGSVRNAGNGEKDELLFILPAGIIRSPDVNLLAAAHCDHGADMTVVFNPGSDNDDKKGGVANIYICNPSVLEHIPVEGYYDIKEGLVPELLRLGKYVNYTVLPYNVGNFQDGHGYLRAIADYIVSCPSLDSEIPSLHRKAEQYLFVDDNAKVDQSARLFGPVVVMDGAVVDKNAVIFGPTIIGRNCRIGQGSIVLSSVLWDGTGIGSDSDVQNCLLDYNVNVAENTVFQNRIVNFEKSSVLVHGEIKKSKFDKNRVDDSGVQHLGDLVLQAQAKLPLVGWLSITVVAAAFLWSYWPNIRDLWNVWQRSDEYSSGILVPFLAVYILWSRRERFKGIPIQPSVWGLFALLFAEGLRLFGLFFMYGSVEKFAVVVSISALVLLILGWQFFKRMASVLLFLCLMLPWPHSVQEAMTLPLQSWATSSAVFCLETIGYNVIREGNIIHIGQSSVAVAEACNGLRMVTAFFVISGLVVMIVRRPRWEKMVVMISSLPIALLCNTLRLVITSIAFTVIKGDYWEKIFHDFGGYAMMPLALAMVVAEFELLRRLTVFPVESKVVIITRQ